VGNPAAANVGGGAAASSVGGNGANNGGGANNAGSANKAGGNNNGGNGTSGSGASGNGTSGNGTAGSNSQAGNGTGTGSSGSTTDGGAGGNGSGAGGDGSGVGGDGSGVGGDGSGVGGDGAGGGSSQDFITTGGTGSSTDFGTGGAGSSTDFATGGGYSFDTATGGGSSFDTATGGGSSFDTATGGGGSFDTATGGGGSFDTATGGGGSFDTSTGGGGSTDFPKCIKTDLNNINVYVIQNVNSPTGGADTEGNMYVGGNFSTVNYSIGKKDGVIDCTQYSLVVGGTVNGAQVHNGKAVAGGAISNSTDIDCPPGIVQVKTLPVDFASLETKVENLSTALHTQLTPNGTVSTDASGALVLTGTDPAQNVFNITSAQLGSVTINVPQTSIVVINVSGTTINWPAGTVTLPGSKGGADSDYLFSSNVIWNFYEATSFTVGGIAIEGTVLAPWATFQPGGGHIAGQVIVKEMDSLATEFHPYYFSACITFPTT
jgi:choice-of-anchor A domain-containing protein